MSDRAAAIRYGLTRDERVAAAIATDKRLPQIRDCQTDSAWKRWIGEAIDPARHKAAFDEVRAYLSDAETGAMDPDLAYDEAEKLLRDFNCKRAMLADLASHWDATAQIRRARRKRTRSKWPHAVAEHLRQTVGGAKDKQWKAIPTEGMMLNIDGRLAEIRRDGDTLCYSSAGAGDKKICEKTFRRRYLKAGEKDVSG